MNVSIESIQQCKRIPKIELHAHLNGSIRRSTLQELAQAQGLDIPSLPTFSQTPLSECFQIFNLIHQVTTTPQIITRITQEVIEDFANDGVVYLELRTTPKHLDCNITKQSYIDAVLDGIDQYYSNNTDNMIDVRLILSIDRREDSTAAMETVHLALSLIEQQQQQKKARKTVVGLDLGGNPTIGNWDTDWKHVFDIARQHNIKVSLHCAEISNEKESLSMIEWCPERLGHMCCMSDRVFDELIKRKIPVEVCLSSNVLTRSVASYNDHHIKDLYYGCKRSSDNSNGDSIEDINISKSSNSHTNTSYHPIVLCTDDCCIFDTTLSKEYALCMSVLKLTLDEMKHLALQGVDATFLNDEEKKELRERMIQLMNRM